jgi:hypothetical protein
MVRDVRIGFVKAPLELGKLLVDGIWGRRAAAFELRDPLRVTDHAGIVDRYTESLAERECVARSADRSPASVAAPINEQQSCGVRRSLRFDIAFNAFAFGGEPGQLFKLGVGAAGKEIADPVSEAHRVIFLHPAR